MSRKIGLLSDIQDLGGLDDNLRGLEQIIKKFKRQNLDAVSCAGDIADKHALMNDLSLQILSRDLQEEMKEQILEAQTAEQEKLKELQESLNLEERQKEIMRKYPNAQEDLMNLYSQGALPQEDKKFVEDVIKFQQTAQMAENKLKDLTKGIQADVLDYATVNYYDNSRKLLDSLNIPVYLVLGNNDTNNAYECFNKSENIIFTSDEYYDDKNKQYLVNRPTVLANEEDDRLCIENYKPKKVGVDYNPTFITTHEPVLKADGYVQLDSKKDGLEMYVQNYSGENPVIIHHGHFGSPGLTIFKNNNGGVFYIINTNNSRSNGLTYGDLEVDQNNNLISLNLYKLSKDEIELDKYKMNDLENQPDDSKDISRVA